ncbi:hypothetical protein J0H58_06025 [bacterium]|nr:hypothetical protein [bacterium]
MESALSKGLRGLPGGDSLAKLLERGRGVRNRLALPLLSEAKVLAWAEVHRSRAGRWPRVHEGPIEDAAGETWSGVNAAMVKGARGLPGGVALHQFLAALRLREG